MNILQTFAKVHEDRLILVYTAALPWCLHSMDQFAEDIGIFSDQEGKQSI
ncbi:uncharacterized protein LACBIDRAFT_310248 [Laccaria bicolor S238N-H82]|uniref:Predicted protein n=1 Tax=Laccaria bicolor (strain S238N-H82 / ATCC MYA-4686) TaxID=486041 RepID=B0DTT1_LACBS|nr:uncharacterized protein LACBIDRAFT_310248 [Laccaria bicolor S238N-H82]EDR02035.1 predicted protein [Laccaria bicolor S238N-H82]|eukprot:XP_001887426.1 predicted protein [Laccaria bicolor S238N-H82]